MKRPQECLGGILADEMGMGKSLALLTLIVHSLGRANVPSQEHNEAIPHENKGEATSRATLIISPKSSNYLCNLNANFF